MSQNDSFKFDYLYLAFEMQEWERNEKVGYTARPPTLYFFIVVLYDIKSTDKEIYHLYINILKD